MSFNERLGMYAGDVRVLRLPIKSADAALLGLAEGGAEIAFWLASNSQPADDEIHVKLDNSDGVDVHEVEGEWFVGVPLEAQQTAHLVGDKYFEIRVINGERRLVVAAGVLLIRPSIGARNPMGAP